MCAECPPVPVIPIPRGFWVLSPEDVLLLSPSQADERFQVPVATGPLPGEVRPTTGGDK